MNATALAFELDDTIVKRPFPVVAHSVVEASEESVTGVAGIAGIALWGELLDHLGLVGECDRRSLAPSGPAATPAGSATGPSWRPSWPVGSSFRTGACWPTRPPSDCVVATPWPRTPRCGASAPVPTWAGRPRPAR